jgi:hypothetical protein
VTLVFKSSKIQAAYYKNFVAYLIPSPSKLIKQAYLARETPILYLELKASKRGE